MKHAIARLHATSVLIALVRCARRDGLRSHLRILERGSARDQLGTMGGPGTGSRGRQMTVTDRPGHRPDELPDSKAEWRRSLLERSRNRQMGSGVSRIVLVVVLGSSLPDTLNDRTCLPAPAPSVGRSPG